MDYDDTAAKANHVGWVHNLSFTFGRMCALAVIILLVWVVLLLPAEGIMKDAARTSREACGIVSTNFTGIGATKDDKGISVSIQASYSFGKVTEISSNNKTALKYALNRPSNIQC